MTLTANSRLSRLVSRLAAILLVIGGLAPVPARAVVELNITQGTIQPLPIAIPDFVGDGSVEPGVAREISGVVANDLKSSGLFIPIDQAAFIEQGLGPDRMPRFEDWRVVNAQALAVGRIGASEGKLKAEFRLWDVFAGTQLAGEQFFARPKDARRVGHIIADAIYERITGEKGYFDTRIVFVDEFGPKNNRMKRLAIMDQDGSNVRLLTTGQNLVLTPRFSPSTQEITYTSFEGETPKVYLLNIETGQKEVVGAFPGMTFAPRFSPDGQRIVMSLERDGNTNLFVMDLRSRRTMRLTNDNAIDTAPCYSPDGREIVFESDRAGSRQLYVMGADGSSPRRIQPERGKLLDAGVVAARRLDRIYQDEWGAIPDRGDAARRVGRADSDRRVPQ